MPLVGPARAVRVALEKASSWESVRRISDKYLPRWIRTLLDGFEKSRAGTSIRALIRLLEGEEFDKVVDEIDWIPIDGPQAEGVRAAYPVLIRDVMESTAAEAAGSLSRRPQIAVVGAFDVVNPRVVDWVRLHSGERITEITEVSRQAIRDLIARGVNDGISPSSLGRMIRQSIGLHSKDVKAIMNMRNRMIADGRKPEMIERAVERYTAKQLRRRAEMIARTEIIQAETQGQLELWRQQIADGNLEPGVSKEWIITDGETCDQCNGIAEAGPVPVGSKFEGGLDGPPAHPRCRCAVALVFRDAKGAAA